MEHRRKLIHQGFRIEESTLFILKNHAAKRGLTLSALVNQVLTRHSKSDIYFEELGSILVPKGIMRTLFDIIPPETLEELGKRTGPAARTYISYLFNEIDSDTLTEFLQILFSRFQAYQYSCNDGRHFFSLIHDVNANFSHFYKGFIIGLVGPIVKTPITFHDQSDNCVAFSWREGQLVSVQHRSIR